ncbi:enoyl-CoA hydratase/isomerase family protein [Sulfitobacter sp. KE34]|uniref:enoyl-CoA hydratase/isomerase family protein n=1 Tax=unclassified Sulfitobacter TaxID=196795 RepID=UPI0014467765|nr:MULTISPECIES: enoyl-CoA hydratase-related protein [unclassified Sulfitobacter]NKX40239.1 enoyl-CoA hydratase/isomerase family protein [Rhodobacteraceae bacterium R_SAG2]MDF3351610.1 enoyl-CoA hydratase/isomerase family protein [Sulfitobacter sp. KE12]MDF3355283.1 enoyl-CoA hydratase/isomerase family protein [Sulfitobacter sp. KE27]MDF3358931.1 enoyl-CoA hydratase/isomerase family protein [Sulfitobacter sp. KE33]MDF3366355.1 enoyl-CoA hydratase/isomerase family protein [Sulfitobacter sp. Ks3
MLKTDLTEGILTVTIDRPDQRNALTVAMSNALTNLWDEIEADDRIRVTVLTSADCGTFCAGMDLKEAAEIKESKGIDVLSLIRDPHHSNMLKVRKPLIAAMTGHFAAGGMMLSLNCDLRVGLGGTKGGITESKIGRGSPWAMPLVWKLPEAILKELTLCGEMIAVERLHALGFVNFIEPTPDAVRARALGIAQRIRDNAPLSVLAAKASIHATMSRGLEAGLVEAKRIYEPVYASEDAQEGPRAFREKREPQWAGR